MEHLAETMTDFLLRHKYITEEQAEWLYGFSAGDIEKVISY